MRRIHRHRSPTVVALLSGLALASFSLVAGTWTSVEASAQVLISPSDIPLNVSAEIPFSFTIKDPSLKLATHLDQVATAYHTYGASWRDQVNQGALIFDASSTLRVELFFNPGAKVTVEQFLKSQDVAVRYNHAPGFFEASMPVRTLRQVAAHEQVYFIRPARRVSHPVGSSTTQGVAQGGADIQHAGGIDGSGTTIAIIDGFTAGSIAGLQASGDWPSGGQLTMVDTDGGGFGNLGSSHGLATLEIAFDMAPGANFIAYETQTVGEWYAAIGSAVTAGADIISASLGAPQDGIGDGSAMPGSIAEAAANARSSGVLVVNSAGNSREQHWGGLYFNSTSAPGTHDWDGAGPNSNVNLMQFCRPNGTLITGSLFWDDWTNVNHDYDLFLFEFNGAGFTLRALSNDVQNGGAGQTPQECVSYTVAGALGQLGCPAGTGAFGWAVFRISAATNRNLQFFANTNLSVNVPGRSLGFPADSPDLITVAAIDVTTTNQESYSSEGPVLATGGGISGNSTNGQKPDVTSFANVDTQSFGPGVFNGTSAAAPHVAGQAALLLDNDPTLTVNDLMTELRVSAALNDLGTAGFDNQYGFGNPVFTTLLPVELTSFDALVDGDAVILHWETASETNNAGFEIQHRYFDGDFEQIDWVEGYGTTELPQQYSYRVENMDPGRYVFRLKQIDFDGTFEYHPNVEVLIELPEAYVLSAAHPNPFNPETQVTLMVATTQQVRVEVFDMMGRRVALLHDGLLEADALHRFVFDARHLPSGLYFYRAIGARFSDVKSMTLMK